MLVSYNLLKTINQNISKYSIEKLSNAFNQLGIEVEQIKKHPVTNGLAIVKIIDFHRHENSDHLNIVNVIDFNNNEYSIVCGANNLEKNKYAIFANLNTKLWNGIIIEKRKIRGIESCGMLCGYCELTNIHSSKYRDSGIILLNENEIKQSTDINYLIGLDDIIFELSIPSNRPDLNAVEILVKELSMVLDFSFDFNDSINVVESHHNSSIIKLNIDQSVCDFYSIIKIKNNNFEFSWRQKEMLLSTNYLINNNIDDLINFYKLIFANPLSIYNGDQYNNLTDIAIKIIDNKDKQLNKKIGVFFNNELVNIPYTSIIKNDFNNHDSCESLFIEIAHFNNSYIKKNYLINDINEDCLITLKNYSNFISVNAFNNYLNYFDSNDMLVNYAYYLNNNNNDKLICFDINNLNSFLGTSLSINELSTILTNMDFNYLIDGNVVKILVNSYRLDIENEYDIYEELLKYININDLDPKPIYANLINYHYGKKIDLENKIANFLSNYGFYETKTYNLVSKKQIDSFNLNKINDFFKIINPISNQREYFRTNLIDSLLSVIEYNITRKRTITSIYEFQQLQVNNNEFNKFLSILFFDNQYKNNINKTSFEVNLINIKWFLKNMITLVNQYDISFEPIQLNNQNITNSFIIKINNINIGYLFEITKKYLKQNYSSIENNVFFAQINCDLLFELNNQSINFKQPSQFPLISRDVNISVDNPKELNSIIQKVLKINYVIDCSIKDVFEKENKKIFTLTIKINSDQKTLENNEINEIMQQINSLL